MRSAIILFIPILLAACSSATKLPECTGEFRPVNVIEQKGAKLDATTQTAMCKGTIKGQA